MSEYVTRIRTTSGDKQIDYNGLANLPDYEKNPMDIKHGGTGAKTPEEAVRNIGAASAADVREHINNNSNPHNVTAEDAHARPDTWMPTATDVGARPNTWTPTASEVGARPDTWMPTASEVHARPDTWMPTATDVGAAPAGYGLGANAINVDEDAITANGYYESAITIGGVPQSSIIWHNQLREEYAHQIAAVVLGPNQGSMIQRVKMGGVWSSWEFVMTSANFSYSNGTLTITTV